MKGFHSTRQVNSVGSGTKQRFVDFRRHRIGVISSKGRRKIGIYEHKRRNVKRKKIRFQPTGLEKVICSLCDWRCILAQTVVACSAIEQHQQGGGGPKKDGDTWLTSESGFACCN
jgi:hypothetical protein